MPRRRRIDDSLAMTSWRSSGDYFETVVEVKVMTRQEAADKGSLLHVESVRRVWGHQSGSSFETFPTGRQEEMLSFSSSKQEETKKKKVKSDVPRLFFSLTLLLTHHHHQLDSPAIALPTIHHSFTNPVCASSRFPLLPPSSPVLDSHRIPLNTLLTTEPMWLPSIFDSG
jgi:hypothetical protein